MKYQRGLNHGPSAGSLASAMQYSDSDPSIFVSNDTRGRVQGEQFPYYSTGAHSVPMEMRQQDAERYRHIWRAEIHAPHLEPGDIGKSDAARQTLFRELKDRASEAEMLRDVSDGNTDGNDGNDGNNGNVGTNDVTLFKGMKNTLYGIEYDLRHWSSLPGKSLSEKLAFVFCRDQRMKYILLILVPIFLVVLVMHLI